MSKKKMYITTAIDYVNAKPHCGHAFEKVLADVLARYRRLQGQDVFFLTGVDENAQKNVEAAQKEGIAVKEFIDRNTSSFLKLCKSLNLSNNEFVRTTAEHHAVVVKQLVKKMIDNGKVYKGNYRGLYCVGCESYYTEKDLTDGKCPEHNKEPEVREEEAYFFKLSEYKAKLLKIIPKYVVPDFRAKEIIKRIETEGLEDICISRKGAKWGIPFPEDSEFKIWVWIDALINYISGLKSKKEKFWPADVHVVGKGINWFHSVIWPAMLLAGKEKLPKKLIVHGYLNINGKKMSKSLGNSLDPLELLAKYPSDTVRYALLRGSVFEDSDFSESILIERNNAELADKLGNLVSRVSTLAEKYGIEKTKNELLEKNLIGNIRPKKTDKIRKSRLKLIESYIENCGLDKALNEIFTVIDYCNEYTQKTQPWKSGDKKIIYELADSIKAIAILLWPFIPETSEKISKIFNFEISLKALKTPLKVSKIKKAPVLFEKKEQATPQYSPFTQQNIKEEQKINKPQSLNKIEGVKNMSEITYEEFTKLDLRVAQIIEVADIEGADKIYKLTIDAGKELGQRTICAGLKQHYKKEALKGRKIVYLSNLAPREMRGITSQGMLLAASNSSHEKVILLSPESDIENGSKIS